MNKIMRAVSIEVAHIEALKKYAETPNKAIGILLTHKDGELELDPNTTKLLSEIRKIIKDEIGKKQG